LLSPLVYFRDRVARATDVSWTLLSGKRLGLVLLCTASFIAVADTTIVTIALPSIRQSLGFSASSLQWVLNGYALTFGGLLLLLGRVGDLYGRRRLSARVSRYSAPAHYLVGRRGLQGLSSQDGFFKGWEQLHSFQRP